MPFKKFIATCALILAAGAAWAAPLKLEPANPQPSSLRPGLAVKYGLPDNQIKTLAHADKALQSARPGQALTGLDYWDTEEGEPTLTSGKAWWVAADISGYVRFDAPGVYTIDFVVNDGIRATIGGQRVASYQQRTPCDPISAVEVEVPQAGWYPLKIVYFQNQGTACLHMRSAPKGAALDWMPDSAFGH